MPFRVRSLTNVAISRVSAETVIRSQRSVPAGSTDLSSGRVGASRPPLSREPCGEAEATADSGSPAWLMIHAMTAEESAPSARIAARSMTSPPDACGRASRVTNARIASSSTPHTALLPRNHSPRRSLRRVDTVAHAQVATTTPNPDVLKTRAAHRTGPGNCGGSTLVLLVCLMPGVPKPLQSAPWECVADLVRAGASRRDEQARANKRPRGEPSQSDSDGPSHFPTSTERARSTFYGEGRAPLRNEDLIEIENAGRRCGVCRSGRGWRRFELVRPAGREPVVLCGGCRARFGDDPPVGRKPSPPLEPVPAIAEPLTPPNRRPGERGPDQHPDRLRAALGKLPGSFSTTMAARAAGINSHRALARLQDLERRGEVRRVGKRWSTESPPSDVAAAMDRLEARTSNVRIVRERARRYQPTTHNHKSTTPTTITKKRT